MNKIVRPSFSCTECSRRKIRCSKTRPCEACLRRKTPHACRFEILPEPGPAAPTPSSIQHDLDAPTRSTVYAEIDLLRRRIFELEGLKARVEALERGHRYWDVTATPSNAEVTNGEVKDPEAASNDNDSGGAEDSAVTLEFLALGADRRPPLSRETTPTLNILDTPAAPLSSKALQALLPRHRVEPILSYSAELCVWQHACIIETQFSRETAAFFDLLVMEGTPAADRFRFVSPAWLALYLVVQVIAITQMSSADAGYLGLSREELSSLPPLLFEGAMTCLEAANYIENPTLQTLQCIAIICSCVRDFVNPNRIATLLAIGIKGAHLLNLHRLPPVEHNVASQHCSGSSPVHNGEHIVPDQLGRRIMYALAVQDWYSMTYRGACMIAPRQLTTALPLAISDEDLEAGRMTSANESLPSPLFKSIYAARLGRILRLFFDELDSEDSSNATFSALSQGDAKMKAMFADLPSYLKPGARDRYLPPYVPLLRAYLAVSTHHKILVLHRSFLASGRGSNSERQKSHHASIAAAREILQSLNRYRHLHCAGVWQIPYHAVSAAALLALHLFRNDSKENAREELVDILGVLRELGATSRIAQRGASVLEDLLREQSLWQTDPQYRMKRQAEGGVNEYVKRVKLAATPTSMPGKNTPDSNNKFSPAGLSGTMSLEQELVSPSTPATLQSSPNAYQDSQALSDIFVNTTFDEHFQALEQLLGRDVNVDLLAHFNLDAT